MSMARENPLPRGVHWRVVRGPGERFPGHGRPVALAQRGEWVFGNLPDTGRAGLVFRVDEERGFPSFEEAVAALRK